jgi:hypothetical protein
MTYGSAANRLAGHAVMIGVETSESTLLEVEPGLFAAAHLPALSLGSAREPITRLPRSPYRSLVARRHD